MAAVISFSAASFPPIKGATRENSLQGRKCFSSFPRQKAVSSSDQGTEGEAKQERTVGSLKV